MQTFALCGSRLLVRPNSFQTIVLRLQRLLDRSDLHKNFALGVERLDFGIWVSGRAVGKTDFLSYKVSRIFPSTGNYLLGDILCRYHVLISPFHIWN